jgi:cytoskeletal protein CcmA (bactofilin family)
MSDNGSTEKQTLVEEGTQFKGALQSTCSIVVRGRVEGELTAPSLTVSPTGAVKGNVKVGDLKSQGEIAGEFDADSVTLSGVVKDNTVIRAKTLEVKLAQANGKMQVVFGECALEIGEMPTREKEKDPGKPQPTAQAQPQTQAQPQDPKKKKGGKDERPEDVGSTPPPAGGQ